MDDNAAYRNWDQPVTAGQLMRAILHIRSVTTKLAGALVALETKDAARLSSALDSYFKEDDILSAFSEELGRGEDAG